MSLGLCGLCSDLLPMTILTQDFFAQPTLTVARSLLGRRLVRWDDGRQLSGIIVETEAYIGPRDTASHASRGRTSRSEVMFGPPGVIYIYLIYGMYHMLNIITEAEGFPAAVLIRAVEPVDGMDVMRANRQKPNRPPPKTINLTNGPGKLCQAFGIDKKLNGWDATVGRHLWLEAGVNVDHLSVASGPRIGIDYASRQDQDAPWRFWITDNEFVSKK
jgi:DNA-3-methyladenine glycosylase